ncbi:MAG: maleylacetate reductase [Rhodospirillaceae bacterium]|nr:maleylacetate reductase [Rhodospirillaceae bacterium]
MENFTYQGFSARVVFGRGTARNLADELDHLSVDRAIILCSPRGRTLAKELANNIGDNRVAISDTAANNMPQSAFDQLKEDVQNSGAECVIALGGGSAIGLGKSWAAETTQKLISVVTTYSGSEMANNWYIGGGEERRGGTTDAALPVTVIYDPDLTLDLPADISAASGMNAMAHATESLYGPDTNPVIQTMSEEAIRLLGENLPKIIDNPRDIEARTNALYAAWIAAGFRATSGLEHVMAQRVRSRFGLEHARTHAISVPYAIAYNREAAPKAMERIQRALGVVDAAKGLYDLNVRLGLNMGYQALGMPEDGIDDAARIVSGMKFPNPRPTPFEDIRAIIAEAFTGHAPA